MYITNVTAYDNITDEYNILFHEITVPLMKTILT